MASTWQMCPHCNARFASPGAASRGGPCPKCGKTPVAAAPATGTHWYYSRNGQSAGPFTSVQLKALADDGTLLPTDLVLRAGTQKWGRAGDVKNLFPLAPPAPPCAPPEVADPFLSRQEALAEAHVMPDAERCVQCGICSYNCPMEIDVRAHAWRGRPIHDSHCLTCSECVNRCPRGVLRFERMSLFTVK